MQQQQQQLQQHKAKREKMRVRAVGIVGRSNAPLLLRCSEHAAPQEPLEHIVYASLDIVEERSMNAVPYRCALVWLGVIVLLFQSLMPFFFFFFFLFFLSSFCEYKEGDKRHVTVLLGVFVSA